MQVDLSKYEDTFSFLNKFKRIIWNIVWLLLIKPIPRSLMNSWKNLIYRCFGAKLHKTTIIYSTAKVYAPWNLEMGAYSCLADQVDCYNQGKITIGNHTTISQKTYLCASSHDIGNSKLPLIIKPITINSQVWIGADAFIGPGVTIGEGAVVGARSAVFKNVEAWSIVGGNPAIFIKKRIITS